MTNFICALVTVCSITGIAYFLNGDFKTVVDKEVSPPIASWSSQHLPSWESMKQSFQQGYQEGKQ
ncbi:MAG TPA: hypothetical protein V6D10_01380 [Trichocoleus sp.]|jgi:hypothetical protein